ncbi:MAG: LacI family DNA-binding transcriptional regulator [Clostridia bacterium]|nr:LacI family DNA-binding transcriptional regulator [Clostridia bacterium]
MKVSIRDLAAKCGLSVSAVSKALNNYPDISEETRRHVVKTAQEMGYFPNASARTLKTNRSRNIGVLFEPNSPSGMTHPFFSALLESFKAEAENRGYDLTFINPNIQSGMSYLEHCRYRNMDGVAVICTDLRKEEVRTLINSEIPTVIIDSPVPEHASILSENRNGMYALTRLAISMGHKKIAYLHGESSYVTDERIEGYASALRQSDIEIRRDYVIASVFDNPREAQIAFKSAMALPDPPTCILMSDDTTAIAAIQTAKDMHLSVPGDISIGGYDGVRTNLIFTPALTTVHQDTAAMGKTAARELIGLIEFPLENTPRHISVPASLVIGESIGKIG